MDKFDIKVIPYSKFVTTVSGTKTPGIDEPTFVANLYNQDKNFIALSPEALKKLLADNPEKLEKLELVINEAESKRKDFFEKRAKTREKNIKKKLALYKKLKEDIDIVEKEKIVAEINKLENEKN